MSGRRQYTPDRGDIVFTNFSPQIGSEMRGDHPCIVLSTARFSIATGWMVACPITSQIKGSPFEVTLPAQLKTKGCVVASEIRTLDFLARGVRFVEKATPALLQAVQAIATAVISK